MTCSSHPQPTSDETPSAAEPFDVSVLLGAERSTFLAFLERRLRDDALAEDIFQDALLRAIESAGGLRDRGALMGWFYRILRNAIVDHFRRGERRHKALAQLLHDIETVAPEPELEGSTCHCVTPLAETLKPEYAEALRRVDVEGATLKGYADEAGITANNAGVRIHRARRALHEKVNTTCGACAAAGCRDCSCARV